MFERYNDHARGIIPTSGAIARALKHSYVGTEHLLLALLTPQPQFEAAQPSMARAVLESFGLTLDTTMAVVIETIGEGVDAPSGHLPFTPRAKKVLELALREAIQTNGGEPGTWVGTEHILLGIVREGEGVAMQTLVKLSVDGSRVRNAVIARLRAAAGITEDRP